MTRQWWRYTISALVLIITLFSLVSMSLFVTLLDTQKPPMLKTRLIKEVNPVLDLIPQQYQHEVEVSPHKNDIAQYYKHTGRLDRVYCMIPTLYTPKRIRLWEAILLSWRRKCDVLKFFVDPVPGTDLPTSYSYGGYTAGVVTVPMMRNNTGICGDGLPCRHIWEKVWRSWVYVFENDLASAEWFLKIDDDTYFIPSNIRRFTRERQWSPDDPHYFGHLFYITKEPFQLISGVCTAFSRESINRLGPRLNFMEHEYGDRVNFPQSHGICVDRDGATEERVTSKCLAEVGVVAENALEDNTREYVVPLGIPFSLTYFRKPDTTSWYWAGKPTTRGDMKDCCSVKAWGIHGYKGSSRLAQMEILMTDVTTKALADEKEVYQQRLGKYNARHPSGDHTRIIDKIAQLQYLEELRQSIASDLEAYPTFQGGNITKINFDLY